MHTPAIVRSSLLLVILTAAALPAQGARAARFVEDCRSSGRRSEQFCETRTVTLAPSQALRVDGRQNGGVTVHAWDNPQFQIVAMVQTNGESQAEAQALARAVTVTATNGEIHAEGPSMDDRDNYSWSVSYEVWAPRRTDLTIRSTNGGISIDGMISRMDLHTTNGGLTLTDIDGDVRGTTTNGGVTVELSGDRWHGGGLDLSTTNGGIRLVLPAVYSARLETGTTNGGLDLGIPVTVQGKQDRRMTADLGNGGAMIRAITTNGGVSVRRK